MDNHFLTKRFRCVDLVYNPGCFSPYDKVKLVIDSQEKYHKREVLVHTLESPPKIIGRLKKKHAEKWNLCQDVIQMYNSKLLPYLLTMAADSL